MSLRLAPLHLLGWMLASICCLPAGAPAAEVSPESMTRAIAEARGLCVEVGVNPETTARLASNAGLVVHCLEPDAEKIVRLRGSLGDTKASLRIEQWSGPRLPHAENLANLVVVHDNNLVAKGEVLRVLQPGGAAYVREGDGYQRLTKERPPGMDEWTHQWHDSGGGLTSEDLYVGVPRGIQWLDGPLFAMAGRKSSTQSLVSANGRNFYVTQNVLENVGLKEMPQFLVARDAFNGMVLWQRPWTGPFVTGNGETNPRMAVSRDRLFVAGNHQVLAIDASTGDEVAEVALDQAAAKIALVSGALFVQTDRGVIAFDKDLQNERWRFEQATSSGMVIADEGVLLLVTGRSGDGQFQHELVCIDPDSGEVRWRTSTQEQITSARVRINFAADGFVALQAHGFLHLYSAEDGAHLWTKQTEARPGKTYVDERFVGHFYRKGLVWMLTKNSPREPDGQNIWVGLSPKTGAVERELTTVGPWPRTATPAKMGCQLLIASDRYIMIPRQATFIDFESGQKLPFKFTRGGCGLGFVPANGLVYSHPHACGCFSEAIRGFMGMHSMNAPKFQAADSTRLTQGAAFGEMSLSEQANGGWPTYRKDGRRSAHSATRIPSAVRRKWSVAIASAAETPSLRGWKLRTGNVASAPTVAGSQVFATDVDRGAVVALDAATGEVRWRFVAGGRVDSPPTLYRGLCLFGSHDGYVYCLAGETGDLVWKYRAAPVDRRIVAFGGLESTWPVAGAVLIRDGVAYAAAGRAPDADGGVEVHALDPLTGTPAWSRRVHGGELWGLCDYLIDGQDAVFLSNWRFDPKTGEDKSADDASSHLRGGKVGLLEASWTKHDLATRKDIQTWTAQGASGQLIAFSDADSAAYQADSHTLTFGDKWSAEVAAPAQLTSLAMSEGHVISAGGKDRADVDAGGWLRVRDSATGKETFFADLPAEAVFDGIALADGCIYVTTQDGQLHCFASE